MVTVDYTGRIITSGYVTGVTEGIETSIWGDVSDDQTSITFNMGESGVDPTYHALGGYYYWFVLVKLDNCDTSYTWSDAFVQLSYVDDEQNTIDLSNFEDPGISGPDTGICREYDSVYGGN